MLWRKKNDGFEWREYVRTTILVRRAERRRRLDDAKAAAAAGLQRAGAQGKEVAREAMSGAASNLGAAGASGMDVLRQAFARLGSGLAHGARLVASALKVAALRTGAQLMHGARQAQAMLGPRLAPLAARLAEPRFTFPLRLIAVSGLAGALYLYATRDVSGELWLALGVGGLASGLLALARLGSETAPRAPTPLEARLDRIGDTLVLLPGLERLTPRAAVATTTLATLSLAGGAIWLSGGLPQRPSLPTIALGELFETPTLQGRASATGGDRLELQRTTMILDGIEAPMAGQTCTRQSRRRWFCGTAAREALSRAVRGHEVVCEIWSRIDEKTVRGRCLADDKDVAEGLVRGGHVFAEEGFFARYASAESAARAASAGLWDGEPLRPQAYKATLWEEAKQKAPGGCPIKGRVSSQGRVYLVPWNTGYASTRIRETRGERWFCSEAEAISAGWRPNI